MKQFHPLGFELHLTDNFTVEAAAVAAAAADTAAVAAAAVAAATTAITPHFRRPPHFRQPPSAGALAQLMMTVELHPTRLSLSTRTHCFMRSLPLPSLLFHAPTPLSCNSPLICLLWTPLLRLLIDHCISAAERNIMSLCTFHNSCCGSHEANGDCDKAEREREREKGAWVCWKRSLRPKRRLS